MEERGQRGWRPTGPTNMGPWPKLRVRVHLYKNTSVVFDRKVRPDAVTDPWYMECKVRIACLRALSKTIATYGVGKFEITNYEMTLTGCDEEVVQMLKDKGVL